MWSHVGILSSWIPSKAQFLAIQTASLSLHTIRLVFAAADYGRLGRSNPSEKRKYTKYTDKVGLGVEDVAFLNMGVPLCQSFTLMLICEKLPCRNGAVCLTPCKPRMGG